MKTIKRTFFMFAVLLMTSCDKTENIEPTDILSNDKTENKILNFAQTLKDVKNHVKSGEETMSLEEAKWNIEAALNYFNAGGDTDEQVKFSDETIEIDIQPINNELTFDQITAIVQEMNDQINNDSNKKLVVADVFIVTKVGGELGIAMTSKKWSSIDNYQFDSEEDYWSFYSNGGYCDGPNEGSATNQGSPERISTHVNMFSFGGWKSRVIGYYYTDIEQIGGSGNITPFGLDYLNPLDDVPGDYYLDHMMFNSYDDYVFDENYPDLCLDPDELNFYAITGMPFIIDYLKPSSKDFVSLSIQSQTLGNITTLTETFFHEPVIRYGVKNPHLYEVSGPWNP